MITNLVGNGPSLEDKLLLSNAMENNIHQFISMGLPNTPLNCTIYSNFFLGLFFSLKRSIVTIIYTIC